MLGAIAGDVIGSRYEFANHRSTDFPLFDDRCEATDDTILTVAVADVLLRDRYDADDYVQALHDYVHAHPRDDWGGNFARWARARDRKPYNSMGNGSAMRVSPVGWAFDALDDVLSEAKRSAAVTHNHPEGIRGAQAIAGAVFTARMTHDKNRVREFITERFGYTLDEDVATLRQTNKFDETCPRTVPPAVQAFLESNDFEHAIRLAVSVGGDTDTIACITGAIAHAHYGDVPEAIAAPLFSTYLNKPLADVTRRFMQRFNVPGLRGAV